MNRSISALVNDKTGTNRNIIIIFNDHHKLCYFCVSEREIKMKHEGHQEISSLR